MLQTNLTVGYNQRPQHNLSTCRLTTARPLPSTSFCSLSLCPFSVPSLLPFIQQASTHLASRIRPSVGRGVTTTPEQRNEALSPLLPPNITTSHSSAGIPACSISWRGTRRCRRRQRCTVVVSGSDILLGQLQQLRRRIHPLCYQQRQQQQQPVQVGITHVRDR